MTTAVAELTAQIDQLLERVIEASHQADAAGPLTKRAWQAEVDRLHEAIDVRFHRRAVEARQEDQQQEGKGMSKAAFRGADARGKRQTQRREAKQQKLRAKAERRAAKRHQGPAPDRGALPAAPGQDARGRSGAGDPAADPAAAPGGAALGSPPQSLAATRPAPRRGGAGVSATHEAREASAET